MIIRFLFKENANAIHKRLQAQFTDDIDSIRSDRCWCQFIRSGQEELRDDSVPGRPPIDIIDTKIL
jgi:hypothetical protein